MNYKMKNFHKVLFVFTIIIGSILFQNCAKENEDYIFKHESNLISQMVLKASQTSGEYQGEIHEFDKDGNMMDGAFTQEDVEGGYGLILFPISKSLENDVNITHVYLRATITYDAMITPTLSGIQDISGDGIIITVTSGEKTKRQYRVRGYYE